MTHVHEKMTVGPSDGAKRTCPVGLRIAVTARLSDARTRIVGAGLYPVGMVSLPKNHPLYVVRPCGRIRDGVRRLS